MDDTFFDVPPDKRPRLVGLYQRKEDGSFAEQARPPQSRRNSSAAEGGCIPPRRTT